MQHDHTYSMPKIRGWICVSIIFIHHASDLMPVSIGVMMLSVVQQLQLW